MKRSTICHIAVSASLLIAAVTSSDVVTSPVVIIEQGEFQAHHYQSSPSTCCDAVVLINVGTAMSVGNYKNLAKQIVQRSSESSSTVAMIIDTNFKGIMKQDGTKYTKLANAIVTNLTSHLPSCCGQQPNHGYIIGGHSGGGQGAFEALQQGQDLNFDPVGFLGLAPYRIPTSSQMTTTTMNISIPSLQWGFSKMSCAVAPGSAARAAYLQSNPSHRVFYRLRTSNWDPIVGGPHCSFADNGCLCLCGGSGDTNRWMHSAVGETVNLFIRAIVDRYFDENQFLIDTSSYNVAGNYHIDLFVNSRTPSTPIAPIWAKRILGGCFDWVL